MENLLLVAHTEGGSLAKVTLEAVNGALQLRNDLGATLTIGLIGSDVQEAANSLAAVEDVKFLAVEGQEFTQSRYATDAAAIERLCREVGATLVIAAGTARMNRVLPGVACRLGGKIDTHVSALSVKQGEISAERWYYRQRMIASFSRERRPWFISVDSSVFPAFSGSTGQVKIESLPVELAAKALRTAVEGLESPAGGAQTLKPDAEILFVAGAGWTKKQADGQMHIKEAEDLILGFLKNSKASLGSSKSLVDQKGEGQAVLSFMTHLNQVGQTGSTPRHPKGLAACCHGEEPHAVGWRFINERRAINLDPNCGWAQGKADVLYVADAFKVIAKINELLS